MNPLRFLVALLACAILGSVGCAVTGPGPLSGPAEVRSGPGLPPRPDLSLPPPPAGRTEEELWRLAQQRADALEAVVRADIAAAEPPVPPEVPAPAPAVAPGPAPGPESVPAAAAPARPVPAPAGRTSVPTVRVVQRYTTENGLPSNRITALYVDREDAWVGTADAGVVRLNFAEGNWIAARTEDGLAADRVSDIVRYRGQVYVGTQKGISIWDGVSWSTEDRIGKVKLFNARFRVHDGLLWVAARTMHGGLLTFDGERWKDRSTIKQGTVLNNVSDFAFSGETLWIGTTNRGVLRYDGKNWWSFSVADGLVSNFIYTLAVQGDTAYLGGCCGVSVFENGAWKIYDIAEGLPHSTVNAIALDGKLVWFGSKKGLGLFDGFEFTNFYAEDGLTDDRITALFLKGDEVWVGTANGLNRLEKSY